MTYVQAVKIATSLETAERDSAVEARETRESVASGRGAGGESSAVHALAVTGSGLRRARASGGAGQRA